MTRFVLTANNIKAGKYYKVRVHSVNCSLQSPGQTITVTSGVEPREPPIAPYVFSYDSNTAMTIKWQPPAYDGGFPITSMKVYVDNAELVELNQSKNFYQMTGLTLGNSYKLQVSALNEIGESTLSTSNTIVFANVPDAPASLTLTPTAGDPSTILIEWEQPTSNNGDAVTSFQVYIDNGRGGPFELVFSGFPSSYSYFAGETVKLDCGYLYMVRVTATNVAGESTHIAESVHLGNVPSNPKSPSMVSVSPDSTLTIEWDRPDSDGCLPVLKYVINKDGVDLADIVAPSATNFADDISIGGSVGSEISYKLKAVNVNGESLYSPVLTVTVGLLPSAPSNLA